MYECPTTKELKKKHSSRPVGGAEAGSWGRDGQPGQRRLAARQRLEDQGGQGGGWQSRRSHIHVPINQEEQLGQEIDHTTQGSNIRK